MVVVVVVVVVGGRWSMPGKAFIDWCACTRQLSGCVFSRVRGKEDADWSMVFVWCFGIYEEGGRGRSLVNVTEGACLWFSVREGS